MTSEWDGKRGLGGVFDGRWISLAEAKERTVGNEEWWKTAEIGGRTVEIKQHDPSGPRDKPIWLYEDGDMYLGEWKAKGPRGRPVEHGVGVYYWNSPGEYKGYVYVGNLKDGRRHGQGKQFWLESSPTWIKNKRPGSVIKQKVNGKSVLRPFTYKGEFVYNFMHDARATVTLKDGTCRVGPWKDDKPVGDWWNDNDHPLAATSVIPAAVSQESTETRPAKRAKRGSAGPKKMETKPGSSAGNLSNEVSGADAASEPMSGDDSIVPMPAPSSNDTVEDSEEKRVQKIKAWLIETIGRNPYLKEMEEYAKKFFEYGFQSIEMIRDECTPELLGGFDWIKPLHKMVIQRSLEGGE